MLQIVINFEEFQLVYNALLIFSIYKRSSLAKIGRPASRQPPVSQFLRACRP